MHVSKTVVPRKLRLRFVLIRDCRWLVPALRCLTLPFAEIRNRFLIPLWVFILDMCGLITFYEFY